ncbi:MAG: LysR substrate-binding domain-containing protein, partial [Kiloniellaceae bacterium]
RRYPEIVLELALDNRMLNLTRREADVALRPTRQPPETLAGRRVTGLASAVYANAGQPLPKDPAGPEVRWVAWEEGAGPPLVARWLAANVDRHAIAYRSNSMFNQASAARNGLGLAVLPCFLGDSDPRLQRVTPPLEDLTTELWLLTHPDLQRTARIRALLDLLYDSLRRQRRLFEGA